MKKVRIFIGSSITELSTERNKIMEFIGKLNNQLIDRNCFVEGYVCEETLYVMTEGGSQKKHNDYIRDSADIALFLFCNKTGVYTLEELDTAIQSFRDRKRPQVHIFLKCPDSLPADSDDIKNLMKKLEDEGYYYALFDNIDTVKIAILHSVASILGLGEVTTKGSWAFCDDMRISLV